MAGFLPFFASASSRRHPFLNQKRERINGAFGSDRDLLPYRDKIMWDEGLEIGMKNATSDFRLTTGLT